MSKIVKCQWCQIKDDQDKMIKGIHNKGYIHKSEYTSCIVEYEKDKEFKRKEQEELDELIDTIVRIMGYSGRQSIPTQFYSSYLQPFRNNDQLYGRIQKRYKEGFSYKTIKETFEYCEKDIKKYVGQKRENGNFKDVMSELKYAWAIVRNNIENMLRDKKKKMKNQMHNQNLIKSLDIMKQVDKQIKLVQNNKNKYNKENDKIDLTTLFD